MPRIKKVMSSRGRTMQNLQFWESVYKRAREGNGQLLSGVFNKVEEPDISTRPRFGGDWQIVRRISRSIKPILSRPVYLLQYSTVLEWLEVAERGWSQMTSYLWLASGMSHGSWMFGGPERRSAARGARSRQTSAPAQNRWRTKDLIWL